jgi:hypothetical protein
MCTLQASGMNLNVTELVDYVTASYLQPFTCKTCYSVEAANSFEAIQSEPVFVEVKVRQESTVPDDFPSTEQHSSTEPEYTTESMSEATDLRSSTPEVTAESSSTSEVPTFSDDLSTFSSSESSSEWFSEPTTNFVTERSDADEALIKLTSEFHQIRVKLVQSAYVIESQQKVITEQSQKILALEKVNKNQLEQFSDENEKCLTELNSLKDEVIVARRIFAIERYSFGLREKLKELRIDQESAA